MSDNDDTERAGTSARVDRGLRKAVPPGEPAAAGPDTDTDSDSGDAPTGFEGVPRDWASAADRRANASGGRFGGTPANEGPPTPASLRRAAAGGTPVELPAEYGGAPRTDEPSAPAPPTGEGGAGSAAGTASAANHGSAVDLPAEYGGPERPVARDADWAAAATDRPMPAADHWGVEDPSAPVEPSRTAAEVAVGHVPNDTDGDVIDIQHPDVETIDPAHPDASATGPGHPDAANTRARDAAVAAGAGAGAAFGAEAAEAGRTGAGVVTGAEAARATVAGGVGGAGGDVGEPGASVNDRDGAEAGRTRAGVVTGAEAAGADAGAAAEHPTGADGERARAGAVGAAAAGAGAAATAGVAGRRVDAAAAAGVAGRRVDAADGTFAGDPDTGSDTGSDPGSDTGTDTETVTDSGRRRAPEDEPAWNRPSGVSPITRSERRAAEAAAAAKATGTTGMSGGFGHVVWALTRVLLGFVFLWAFLDRLFGLGYPTPRESAWRDGGSPTTGYLDAVQGPLRTWADMLAGRSWVDWVFMIALAAIAVALILGVGVTLAAIGGAILLLMIWAASLPLGDNPFVNQHLIYALVLIGIAFTGAGLRYSLAPWWRRTALVRTLPFLR